MGYTAIENHSPGARVIIPPRKDAVLSPKGATSPTQRDTHMLVIESDGRLPWKRTSGYYAQSHAENTFSRYKRTFGGHMRAKRDEVQERKPRSRAGCSIRCGNWVVPNRIGSAASGVQ